jgi:3-isopropylmalate/(R)-2-methylmalate dehydratase small subunit
MEHIDPGFARRVSAGDLIVGGSNFGCGPSREIAPWAIKGAGISCVVARSFARIFFRNAIDIALPLLEYLEAAEGTEEGDSLEMDLLRGEIRNLSRGKTFKAGPYSDFIRELVAAGGLVEYAGRLLQKAGGPGVDRDK